MEKLTPLVVDLEGTLINSSLSLETANKFVASYPLRIPYLVYWLARGRAHLNARLADRISINAAALPFNKAVFEWLRRQNIAGRSLILLTRGDRNVAEAISAQLRIFDRVIVDDGFESRTSAGAQEALVEEFGSQGFDFVGGPKSDKRVWSVASRVHLVTGSRRVFERAERDRGEIELLLPGRPGLWSAALTALRPHQWLKNLLIFVPLLAARRNGSINSVIDAVLAFVCFCLMASAAYVMNDLMDVEVDRLHHRKRLRPLASGDLNLAVGWVVCPVLMAGSIAIGMVFLPLTFSILLAVYYLLTVAYSFRLRRVVTLDVIVLAGLYTLRIVGGAAAIAVPLSFWLLTFSMFLFLSMAFIKRFSELKAAREVLQSAVAGGRGYRPDDLESVAAMGVASGYVAILVLALYTQEVKSTSLYRHPYLLSFACPILLYWVSRAWLIAHRGQMHDDPIIFAMKDPVSLAVGAACLTIFVLATVS